MNTEGISKEKKSILILKIKLLNVLRHIKRYLINNISRYMKRCLIDKILRHIKRYLLRRMVIHTIIL
jgi:hypothetical protein